jgi:hypothetical protein
MDRITNMYYNRSKEGSSLSGLASGIGTSMFGGAMATEVPVKTGAMAKGDETKVPVTLPDCPVSCHDETSYEDWYITDQPCEGCLPFALEEKTIECDAPDANQAAEYQPDCNDFKSALRSMGIDLSDRAGSTPQANSKGVYGLSGLSSCTTPHHSSLSGCGCSNNKSISGSSCGCGLRGLSNAKGDTAGGDVDLSETGYYDGDYNGGSSSKARDAMMATGFLNLPMWLWLLLGGASLGYAASRYLTSKGE